MLGIHVPIVGSPHCRGLHTGNEYSIPGEHDEYNLVVRLFREVDVASGDPLRQWKPAYIHQVETFHESLQDLVELQFQPKRDPHNY
jgi:hypothetical protein